MLPRGRCRGGLGASAGAVSHSCRQVSWSQGDTRRLVGRVPRAVPGREVGGSQVLREGHAVCWLAGTPARCPRKVCEEVSAMGGKAADRPRLNGALQGPLSFMEKDRGPGFFDKKALDYHTL